MPSHALFRSIVKQFLYPDQVRTDVEFWITPNYTSSTMIGVLVSVLLLLLALLYLAHHRWENSAYVRTIDLIPGVRRKFIVGNVTALPKESDGMLKLFSFVRTTTWLSSRCWLLVTTTKNNMGQNRVDFPIWCWFSWLCHVRETAYYLSRYYTADIVFFKIQKSCKPCKANGWNNTVASSAFG